MGKNKNKKDSKTDIRPKTTNDQLGENASGYDKLNEIYLKDKGK